MSTRENATLLFYPRQNQSLRLFALWYFAGLLIVWNVLGHTVLGFEQEWIHPLIGVGSALFFQIVLDWVDARSHHRAPRFLAGWRAWADFSPPAVITGLAIYFRHCRLHRFQGFVSCASEQRAYSALLQSVEPWSCFDPLVVSVGRVRFPLPLHAKPHGRMELDCSLHHPSFRHRHSLPIYRTASALPRVDRRLCHPGTIP